MLKRAIDIILATFGLLLITPLFFFIILLIWFNDFNSPFYFAKRAGRDNKLFNMIKFRTMKVGADKSGVASTALDDNRITKIGHFLRRYKVDELPNLLNILVGSMSFVGPRPNLKRETDLYTNSEKALLSMRPGMTDIASIVFSDEGEILKGSNNPDLDYDQLIRPWKSRLGIIYINKNSFLIDIKLIYITIIAIISRKAALKRINKILLKLNVNKKLISVCMRETKLTPHQPPE